MGKKLAGITVVVGARITGLGGPGDVFVSSTAAELSRGAGFGFDDRGTHALKGVEGEWRVFGVSAVDGRALPPAADADEAKARRDELVASETRARPKAALMALGAGLAVLVAVGLGFLLTRGPELIMPGPDTVARIDPSRNNFDRMIDAGSNAYPGAITFGGGKLWIANIANKTILGLDPATGEGSVFGTRSTPTGISFVDDRLWVTFGFSADQRSVGVLDPETSAMHDAPFSVPNGSYPIIAAAGSVWIADPLGSTVTRYDPAAQVVGSLKFPTGSGPVDIRASAAASPRSLWVAAGREPSVFLVDIAHPGRPPRAFGTRDAVPTALAVAPNGSAWIVSEQSDTVLAITRDGMITVHRVLGNRCDGPAGIAATADGVWVSCTYSRRVVRLNANDGSFVTGIPVGGTPGAMAVDSDGAVWVAIEQAAFE